MGVFGGGRCNYRIGDGGQAAAPSDLQLQIAVGSHCFGIGDKEQKYMWTRATCVASLVPAQGMTT